LFKWFESWFGTRHYKINFHVSIVTLLVMMVYLEKTAVGASGTCPIPNYIGAVNEPTNIVDRDGRPTKWERRFSFPTY
jgi:hypothetical protein